jgi:hypothetical protein
MSDLYPTWFVPVVVIVAATELVLSLLALKLSRALACVLCVLIALQILAAVYIVNAPPYVSGAADLGGANLGPAIVFFFAFWGSVLAWIGMLVVAFFLLAKRKTLHDA